MELKVHAPWKLTGDGYILFYRFKREFIQEQGFVPPFLEGSLTNTLGAIMLVDYKSSDVGPYRELLFVPGMFNYHGRNFFSVTKIYVSTMASVVNGQENWGLPKELANFDVQQIDAQTERIQVTTADGQPFFDTTLTTESPVRVPVNTQWSPFPATLIQQHNGKTLLTTPTGHGTLQFVGVVNTRIVAGCFPNVTYLQPLAAVKAVNFQLIFPVPETI